MPASYDRLGVHFQYPENWELDEGEPFADRNSVTVYSPGGSFWALVIHPPDDDIDERTAEVVATLKAEYPDMDIAKARETLAGRDLVGYDLNFFYLDLTNTALIRAWKTAEGLYVVLCQAEDREFAAIEEVFRAITISLLWHQGGERTMIRKSK